MTLTTRLKWGLGIGVFIIGLVSEGVAAQVNSDLQAQVEEGKDTPVPPLFGDDPEDAENKGTATPGLLKIDRVPNLHFGNVIASGLYQMEYASNTNPYLQVSDFRGSLGGWSVSAKISDFVSKRTEEDTRAYLLSGAVLTLHQGAIQEYNTAFAASPISHKVALNKQYQEVTGAVKGTGQGIWATRWQSNQAVNQQIELAILPETAQPGRNYEATISWKLSDVPRSE